jgi:hypothetical protein
VTVLSVGWTPANIVSSLISGTNATDFVIADDACSTQTLALGSTCAIAVLDVPAAAGLRTATLEITDSALDSPQLVSLRGGVPGPQITLLPAVGPPGIVTVVSGTGFPPGALVSLRWDRGITQRLDPVAVAPDGTFSIGILVFHHDQLGPRQLLLTAGPGGPPFPDQALPFLVVPGPLQPPGTSAITFLAPDLKVILIRR